MDFLFSGRFVVGLILGAVLYHFWWKKYGGKKMGM